MNIYIYIYIFGLDFVTQIDGILQREGQFKQISMCWPHHLYSQG